MKMIIAMLSILAGLTFMVVPEAWAQDPDSVLTIEISDDPVVERDVSIVPPAVLRATPSEVTLEFLSSWTVTDRNAIEWLLVQMVPNTPFDPETRVEAIKFIDVTANGPLTDDIVIYEPSGDRFFLGEPGLIGDNVRAFVAEWPKEPGFTDAVGESVTPDELDPEQGGFMALQETGREAEYAILAELWRGIERNYGNTGRIQLFVDRQEDGNFNFGITGYNEAAMSFRPKGPGIPDSVSVWDLLYSDRMVADTSYQQSLYDIMYIDRNVQETVLVPAGLDDATLERIRQLGERRREEEGVRLRDSNN